MGEKLSPLEEAGCILLGMARASARAEGPAGQGRGLPDSVVRKQLARVRGLLAQGDPKEDPHRYMAAKNALETLKARERGDAILPWKVEFLAHVEAVTGGAREVDLGGKRPVPNKKATLVYYLRAAAYKLWQTYPEGRDQLIRDAREHEVFGSTLDSVEKTKIAFARKVKNFKYRSDDTAGQPRSPEMDHWDLVTDLVDNYGYRRLTDFI